MYKTCITPIRRNAPGRCGEGGCRAPTLWPKTERAKARKSLFGRGLRPLRFADPRRHPRGFAVSGNSRPSPSPCALRTKGIRGEIAAQPVSPYSPKTRPDQRILLETPGETLGETLEVLFERRKVSPRSDRSRQDLKTVAGTGPAFAEMLVCRHAAILPPPRGRSRNGSPRFSPAIRQPPVNPAPRRIRSAAAAAGAFANPEIRRKIISRNDLRHF